MRLSRFRFHLIGGLLTLVCFSVLAMTELPRSPLIQRIIPKHGWLPWNMQAPDFYLATAQGQEISLKQLKGSSTMLIFVTPNCPYCKKLKEELLQKELPDLQNHVVFISQKSGSQKLHPEWQKLESQLTDRFLVLQDTTGSVFEAYNAQSVPATYWIDERGKVRTSGVGVPMGLKMLQKLIDRESR